MDARVKKESEKNAKTISENLGFIRNNSAFYNMYISNHIIA